MVDRKDVERDRVVIDLVAAARIAAVIGADAQRIAPGMTGDGAVGQALERDIHLRERAVQIDAGGAVPCDHGEAGGGREGQRAVLHLQRDPDLAGTCVDVGDRDGVAARAAEHEVGVHDRQLRARHVVHRRVVDSLELYLCGGDRAPCAAGALVAEIPVVEFPAEVDLAVRVLAGVGIGDAPQHLLHQR